MVIKKIIETITKPRELFFETLISTSNFLVIIAVTALLLISIQGLEDEQNQAIQTLLDVYTRINNELPAEDITEEITADTLSPKTYDDIILNTEQLQKLFMKVIVIFTTSFIIFFIVNTTYHFFLWGRAHSIAYKTLTKKIFSRVYLYYILFNLVIMLVFLFSLGLSVYIFPAGVAATVIIILNVIYWYYTMLIRYRYFGSCKKNAAMTFFGMAAVVGSSLKLGITKSIPIIKTMLAIVGLFVVSIAVFALLTYLVPATAVAIMSIIYFIIFIIITRQFYARSLQSRGIV